MIIIKSKPDKSGNIYFLKIDSSKSVFYSTCGGRCDAHLIVTKSELLTIEKTLLLLNFKEEYV